jgi:hypothetical protein
MAIVVLEEMLGGLDEVKEALDRAITVLTDLVEECDPEMAPQLPDVLDHTLLQPLTLLCGHFCQALSSAFLSFLVPTDYLLTMRRLSTARTGSVDE